MTEGCRADKRYFSDKIVSVVAVGPHENILSEYFIAKGWVDVGIFALAFNHR